MAANPDPVWPGPFQFRSGSVQRAYVYLKVIYKHRDKRHLTTTMQILYKKTWKGLVFFKQGFQGYATPNKGFQSVFRIRIHWFWIRIQHFRLNTVSIRIRIQGFDDLFLSYWIRNTDFNNKKEEGDTTTTHYACSRDGISNLKICRCKYTLII